MQSNEQTLRRRRGKVPIMQNGKASPSRAEIYRIAKEIGNWNLRAK